MKNLLKYLIVTVCVISLFAVQNYSYAFPGGEEGQWSKKWEEKIAEIHKQLGITPQQQERLKAHREQFRSQTKALFQQIKGKKDEISQELQKSNFDINKVRQIHTELKSLQGQMEDNRLEGILEVRKILTPEQFTKFMQMKKEWKEKKHDGFRKHDMKDIK